jgi:hypothetical protein
MTQHCLFVLLHRTIRHHIIVFTQHHIMMSMYAHTIVSLSYYHSTLLYTHARTALTRCFRAKMDPRQAFISQHLSKDDMRYEKTGVCVCVCLCLCVCVCACVCPHARARDTHNNSQKQAHFPAATSRISSADPPPLPPSKQFPRFSPA